MVRKPFASPHIEICYNQVANTHVSKHCEIKQHLEKKKNAYIVVVLWNCWTNINKIIIQRSWNQTSYSIIIRSIIMVFYSLIQKYTQSEPVFQERAKKKKREKKRADVS